MPDMRTFSLFPERDGVTCIFCGAKCTDVPGDQQVQFWNEHETRAHKLAQLRLKAQDSGAEYIANLIDTEG